MQNRTFAARAGDDGYGTLRQTVLAHAVQPKTRGNQCISAAPSGKTIARALRDCQGSVGEIDEIVLVGGSCHMPLVQQYLRHILGKAPLCDFDADTTVAIGAGIAAGIKERSQDLRDTILTDICPFTLGVNVINTRTPRTTCFPLF